MIKKILTATFGACCLLALAFGAVYLVDNRMPAFRLDGSVIIGPDTGIEEVFSQLDSLQPVSSSSLRRVFKEENVQERMKPGSYQVKADYTAKYVARAFTHNWQTPVKLTISGTVRTLDELSEKLDPQILLSAEEIKTAFSDPGTLSRCGLTAEQLFAVILPDTYEVYWNASAEDLLKRFKKEYDAFWTPERKEQAAAQGLTPFQVSIIASIVAQESNIPAEYPLIASVYISRLKKGMKLQACPTVCYIYDYKIRRVLYSHLANPSPYNTYVHEGLPPSPICIPEKVHIEAVLSPDRNGYLYFCADPALNGRNVFSKTFAEHSRYAEQYRSAISARGALAQQQQADEKRENNI